jgi:hypothetical protein
MTLTADAVHQATQRIERLIDPDPGQRDTASRELGGAGRTGGPGRHRVRACRPDLHPVLANARTCRAAGACAGSRATPQRYANCMANQLSLSIFSAAQP